MTSGGSTPEDGTGPVPWEGAGAVAALLSELATTFRRLRPQGSLRWNTSDAWVRLEGAQARLAQRLEERPAGSGAGAVEVAGPGHGGTRGAALAVVERARAKLRPLVATGPSEADDQRWGEVAEALDATLEALRYLTARVVELEDAAERRRRPVDGLDWLVPPRPLGHWVGPVADWLAAAPAGLVLHAECGAGELALGLSERRSVEGVEPRSTLAWVASERGLRVHPMPVADHLAALEPETLGALVLSGVVDWQASEELLALVELATSRLRPAAPLLVIGSDPAAARQLGPLAEDLLPGHPLQPETWALVLERAGYLEVALLPAPEAAVGSTFAVGGWRP